MSSVFLVDRGRGEAATSRLYERPVEVVRCRRLDQVRACLRRIDAAVAHGLHAAGWVAYEAGAAFESALPPPALRPGEDLVWMGLYEECTELSARARDARLARMASGQFRLGEVRLDRSARDYVASIERIHELIREGETYQVNFTLRSAFGLDGSAAALFAALSERQRTEYSALVEHEGGTVLSLSPELFFRRRGSAIELRPMKGTAPRGATEAETRRLAAALAADPKNRAENVMIVDLLRNDIGRLARPGSVAVPRLFHVEPYDTLLQMTSTVTAEVPDDVTLSALFEALFPCGSVTGAPKVRTMQIIDELETSPRGIYAGAIGYVEPGGDACFNVAIRTAVVDREGRGTMGVGSGIVIDSDPIAEFEECRLKAMFLTQQAESAA